MYTYNAFRIYKYQLAGQSKPSFIINHDYEETTKKQLRLEHEKILKHYLLSYELVFFVDIDDEDDKPDYADMLEAAIDQFFNEIYPMQVSGKLWYGDESLLINAVCRLMDNPQIEAAEIWGRDSWKRVAETYR